MATTQDCIDFIQDNCNAIAKKWKRLKKYKINGFDIREFINDTKDTLLVISESQGGELKLIHTVTGSDIAIFNGKEELLSIIPAEGNTADLSSLKSLTKDCSTSHILRAMQMFNQSKTREEYLDSEWGYALLDFDKPDYEDIRETTREYMTEKGGRLWDGKEFQKNWLKEFKILFDCENVHPRVEKFSELPGFEFLFVECGGDWEHPINVFLYISPKLGEDKVASFVPTDKGNIYIKKAMCAVGSLEEVIQNPTDEDFALEAELQDFCDKKENYGKAEKIAFESFKKHLLQTEK